MLEKIKNLRLKMLKNMAKILKKPKKRFSHLWASVCMEN